MEHTILPVLSGRKCQVRESYTFLFYKKTSDITYCHGLLYPMEHIQDKVTPEGTPKLPKIPSDSLGGALK